MKKYNYLRIVFCIFLSSIFPLSVCAQDTKKSDVIQKQIEHFACSMNDIRTGISAKDNKTREEQEIYLLDLLNKKFQIDITRTDSLYVYFLNKSQEDHINREIWILQANHFLKWKEIYQMNQQLWEDFYNKKKLILLEETLNVMRLEQNDSSLQKFEGNSVDYELVYRGRCIETILNYFTINCQKKEERRRIFKRKRGK